MRALLVVAVVGALCAAVVDAGGRRNPPPPPPPPPPISPDEPPAVSGWTSSNALVQAGLANFPPTVWFRADAGWTGNSWAPLYPSGSGVFGDARSPNRYGTDYNRWGGNLFHRGRPSLNPPGMVTGIGGLPSLRLYANSWHGVRFFNLDVSGPYTICSVDSYIKNGQAGRTLQSENVNWLLGRWAGRMGHFTEGWLSMSGKADGWDKPHVFCAEGRANYRSYWVDGVKVAFDKNTPAYPRNLGLGSAGVYSTEFSDALFSELIVWQRSLSEAEIKNYFSYATKRYKIPSLASSPFADFNPRLWLDGSKGMVSFSGGVPVQGERISQWQDVQTGSYNMAWAQQHWAPRLQMDTGFGKNVVRFGVSEDFNGMCIDDDVIPINTYTIVLVDRYYGKRIQGRTLQARGWPGSNWLLGRWSGRYGFYAEDWVSMSPVPDANWHISVAAADYFAPGGGWRFFASDGEVLTDEAKRSGGPGQLGLVGCGRFGGEVSQADVGEVIVWTYALTTAQIIKVEDYLAAKYNPQSMPLKEGDAVDVKLAAQGWTAFREGKVLRVQDDGSVDVDFGDYERATRVARSALDIRVGDRVEAKLPDWQDPQMGAVVKVNADGSFDIRFDSTEGAEDVPLSSLRLAVGDRVTSVPSAFQEAAPRMGDVMAVDAQTGAVDVQFDTPSKKKGVSVDIMRLKVGDPVAAKTGANPYKDGNVAAIDGTAPFTVAINWADKSAPAQRVPMSAIKWSVGDTRRMLLASGAVGDVSITGVSPKNDALDIEMVDNPLVRNVPLNLLTWAADTAVSAKPEGQSAMRPARIVLVNQVPPPATGDPTVNILFTDGAVTKYVPGKVISVRANDLFRVKLPGSSAFRDAKVLRANSDSTVDVQFSDTKIVSGITSDSIKLRTGTRCEAKLQGWADYKFGTITAANDDDTVDMEFDDGSKAKKVRRADLKAYKGSPEGAIKIKRGKVVLMKGKDTFNGAKSVNIEERIRLDRDFTLEFTVRCDAENGNGVLLAKTSSNEAAWEAGAKVVFVKQGKLCLDASAGERCETRVVCDGQHHFVTILYNKEASKASFWQDGVLGLEWTGLVMPKDVTGHVVRAGFSNKNFKSAGYFTGDLSAIGYFPIIIERH